MTIMAPKHQMMITSQVASVKMATHAPPNKIKQQSKTSSILSLILLSVSVYQYDAIQGVQSWSHSAESTTASQPFQINPETFQIDNLKSHLLLGDSANLGQLQSAPDFPGISKDVAAFCSARPSLQIDMASMIVHVKRNASFNYKLYLFSEDYVFQTGQIVPRDDFRIHAFPVKAKRLRDFWRPDVSTFEEGQNSLKPIGSELFQYRRFFSPVLIDPTRAPSSNLPQAREQPNPSNANPDSNSNSNVKVQDFFTSNTSLKQTNSSINQQSQPSPSPPRSNDFVGNPEDDSINTSSSASISSEPVDLKPVPTMKRRSTRSYPLHNDNNYQRHQSSNRTGASANTNPNANIDFDRDDQVSLVTAPQRVSPSPSVSASDASSATMGLTAASAPVLINNEQQPVVVNPSIMAALKLRQPQLDASGDNGSSNNNDNGKAGASSFNSQAASQDKARDIYRDTQTIIPVGSFSSFHVNISYFVRKDFRQPKPELIKVGINANTFKVNYVTLIRDLNRGPNNEHSSDDYQFLTHKLLSDPNTRITAISQIYHDWITRNFYTVVYIQRLLQPAHLEPGDLSFDESQSSSRQQQQPLTTTISNDRLIFRGASANLLGAVQLDYGVRASAFITDKNGLHYFLDFLSSSNKFYIAAVDWTEKPFKFIDSQRFPIRVTRTLLDNEELLLCPPAFCHSVSPVDEIVAYGHLQLDDETQQAASILTGSFPVGSAAENITTSGDDQVSASSSSRHVDFDRVIANIQNAASELKVKLHLRDWIWQLEQTQAPSQLQLARSLTNGGSRSLQRRSSGPFLGSSASSNTTSFLSNGRDNNNNNNRQQVSNKIKHHRLYVWRYKWAQRNDIKGRHDIYGYPLTGNNIDAAFRVYNQVHLISANFLITINYTKANETLITKKPLGEEFQQLSSTIIDPISGVFYDRYANQVFFFKGDRYIGYDYATRKPIEDFLLNDGSTDGAMVLSSLPVIGIIGRQHSVDGIYHDLSTDLVHIFEGMKFYTYDASEFKSGSFRSDASKKLPPIRCTNTHFLTGCHFDMAFPNPCRDSTSLPNADPSSQQQANNNGRTGKSLPPAGGAASPNEQRNHWPFVPSAQTNQFIGEQQEKVRELAKSKLVNILGSENSFNALASQDISGYVGLPKELAAVGDSSRANSNLNARASASTDPLLQARQSNEYNLDAASRRHEKALIYMLVSLVSLTIFATLVIIILAIYSSGRSTNRLGKLSQSSTTIHQAQLSNHNNSHHPAPYDSLAQLQASALQAVYNQQQQQGKNNTYSTLNSSGVTRYMTTEPIMMLGDTSLRLPAAPASSTYIRSQDIDPMTGMIYGGQRVGDMSNSSTPPGSSLNHHNMNNHASYIPQNTNNLVVKGRRYDTHKRATDITDNSVL